MNQNGGIHKGGFAVLCHRNGGSESPGILNQPNDKMSDEEIAEMGQKAKKRVAEEYTWDKICGQYEEVFK